MNINKYKHKVAILNNVKCSIIENNCNTERIDFLKKLLEHNNYEVIIVTENNASTIGVIDILFNPLFSIYEKKLKTLENNIVNPMYWDQLEENIFSKFSYWECRPKAIIDADMLYPWVY